MTRRRSIGFNPSLQDQRRANLAAQKAMVTEHTSEAGRRNLAAFEASVKPKRERAKTSQPSLIPLERDVQRAIIEYLSAHRSVAFYGRFNSGTAITGDAQGNTRYTRFNTIKGFPDIHGMMKGGRALYIEVKRPGGKLTDEQAEFLKKVRDSGGIGFMAESVEDVAVALTAAGY